ncbi:MAG: helix-turn-helix domain-containing protein [Deltaproteobacteria bacterium]|nr:helix-turn-helix domain-containing protein [Deltaproteobacteria bacterium]MBW2417401.1 helix-turn-helix domain-containing protein [Deltaproteobacteria bacterium]
MASESRGRAGADRPEPPGAGGGQEPHIGAYLAGQRKLRGISRQELAEQTRIPLRSLERLESGLFDSIDDGFVRGFVRTVSAALGLDPEDALTRMLPEPAGPNESPIFRRLALGHVLLLVGALVVVAGSIGIVSAVIRPAPEREVVQAEGLRRRDPVRALALAQGAAGIPGEVVLAVSAPGAPDSLVSDPASDSTSDPAPDPATGEEAGLPPAGQSDPADSSVGAQLGAASPARD